MRIGRSLFNMFLSFRFITVIGIVLGLWVYSLQSEKTPLTVLLTEGRIYLASVIVVIGVNLLLWVFVEKASLYDITGYFVRVLRDTIVVNALMLGTVAACFLVTTFLLA